MNIKKIVLFLFIIVISLCITSCRGNNLTKEDKQSKTTILTSDIVSKINKEYIDEDFINWIIKNYNVDINYFNDYLSKNEYDDLIFHKLTGYSLRVLTDNYNNLYENKNNIAFIDDTNEILFVGDVSLADNWFIMKEYDKTKNIESILSRDIISMMNSSFTVVNNEFTISNRGTKMPNKMYTFRASKDRLKLYEEMGVNLVTLANNHVYDYGIDAFNDTLDYLEEYNIPYIGAGRNLEEAKKIYYFIINGYKVAFVNATRAEKNILTPGASDNSGGVLRCYDTTIFKEVIKEAKENSDYVIALVHYGKESSHKLEDVQTKSSYEYIDSGADVIVGTHAHVLQGIEFYKNKPIIYNLGNFMFNCEKVDTGIFKIVLNDDGTMDYYFIPALQENNHTKLVSGSDKIRIINDMNAFSVNAYIDKNNKIGEK